jgi:4'-phosphopantetheinyl transferase
MWLSPPTDLQLNNQEVHIWQTHLDVADELLQTLAKTLSEDEKIRADRFYFEQHRQRFIVARGMLRSILGRYLNTAPQEIKFDYTSRGKPLLAQNDGSKNLKFNVSHSQELALYGFSWDRQIGVDLEYLRALSDAENIAKRFFTLQEFATLSNVALEKKEKAFFQLWTAKEAYLKATGEGLSSSLDQVEIALQSDQVQLLSINGNFQTAAQWSLYSLIPAPNYLATVAVEGHDWKLQFWQS